MTRSTSLASLAISLLLTALCAASDAATLNVPAQYTTIQAAIHAANPGDTVLIAGGTYSGAGNVGLDYGGKAITVTSQNGPAATIIECKGSGNRGVLFHSGETTASKLNGVTIQDGFVSDSLNAGGAIAAINGSNPTISNCVFASNYGGGVGGAVVSDNLSVPTVINCTFLNNFAQQDGGGLAASGSVIVRECTFTGNQTGALGGGIYLGSYESLSKLPDGATGATATGCSFLGNSVSGGNGGGLYSTVGVLQNLVTNCVFVGNMASGGGSGGGVGGGTVLMTNCTSVGNTAVLGAGSSIGSGETNCIFYGDNGPELPSGATVTNCDVQGGAEGMDNLIVVPQFIRTPSLGGTMPDYGDLHLRTTSPCLRAGIAANAPLTTIDGVTRPVPPSLGAYEVGPAVLTDDADSDVTSASPTTNDGTAPIITVATANGVTQLGYLKFDLSSLSALAPTGTIKLRVAGSLAASGKSSLAVLAVSPSWTETGITYANHPSAGTPLGFINLSGTGYATYTVDMTPYVLAQEAAGQTTISVVLTQYNKGPSSIILSKDNTSGTPPQLIVTY